MKMNCARGFTLLEVMVAVAILSIALVAIAKANLQSLDALTTSGGMTTATVLAANKLAEVEAVGAEQWTELQGDCGEDYPDFTWQVETAPTSVEGLVRVTVIVKRNEMAGTAVHIEELLFSR